MTPADGTNRISPEISITKASTRSNASRPSASSGSLFRASTYVPYSALIHPQGGNLFGSVTTSTPFAGSAPRGVTPSPSEEKDPFQQFITLQTFERFYGFDAKMLKLTGVSFGQHRVLEDLHLRLWATILVMSILKRKISDEKGAWYVLSGA